MLEPSHALLLSLREAWLPDAVSTSDKAQLPSCADVRHHARIVLVSFVSYWHKVSVMCPQRHKGLGATAQRTCLPTGASGFTIVIVSAATRRAVRHYQVQEALTPVPPGCVQQRHNRVYTLIIHWVYDNTLHQRIGDARKWSACVHCVQ